LSDLLGYLTGFRDHVKKVRTTLEMRMVGSPSCTLTCGDEVDKLELLRRKTKGNKYD
jgi:hypothetical protein